MHSPRYITHEAAPHQGGENNAVTGPHDRLPLSDKKVIQILGNGLHLFTGMSPHTASGALLADIPRDAPNTVLYKYCNGTDRTCRGSCLQ